MHCRYAINVINRWPLHANLHGKNVATNMCSDAKKNAPSKLYQAGGRCAMSANAGIFTQSVRFYIFLYWINIWSHLSDSTGAIFIADGNAKYADRYVTETTDDSHRNYFDNSQKSCRDRWRLLDRRWPCKRFFFSNNGNKN